MGLGGLLQIRTEAELSVLVPLPVGTMAELPRPDGTTWRYSSVGHTTPEVMARLGWVQGNVWLREPERLYTLSSKHGVFRDIEQAIAIALAHPASVHADRRTMGAVYFFIDASLLRQEGLLRSRSTTWVDAIIEQRPAQDQAYLRLFHFSPTRTNRGGRQLWP